MPVLLSLRSGLTSAGICCLLAGLVLAQQDQTGQSGASRTRGSESNQSTSSQNDRSTSAQSGRTSSQSLDRTAQTSGLGTGAQSASGGQSRQIEQYLTACLLADNQSEVELSQFAQQHATSSDVKEFAQKMVQDHQKMIQQLQQLPGAMGSTGRSGAYSATATESGRNSTTSGSNAAQSSTTRNNAT